MNRPIRLNRPVEAWNIDGSSSATPESSSFIRDLMNATGRRVGRCSFEQCDRLAVVGGHVWISRREGTQFGRPFLAPICRQCNSPRNLYRMQGANARLRANIVVVPVSVTEGMLQAQRRFAGRVHDDNEDDSESESESESASESESESASDSESKSDSE